MTEQRFRVGIVGLEPGRGWAARAHVPALRALSDSYEIVGVANTSLASAQRAAAALGLPEGVSERKSPTHPLTFEGGSLGRVGLSAT